jgi:hypothetical protein
VLIGVTCSTLALRRSAHTALGLESPNKVSVSTELARNAFGRARDPCVQCYTFLHIQLACLGPHLGMRPPRHLGPMALQPVPHLFFPADAQRRVRDRKPKTGFIERRFKSKRESKHLPRTIHHQERPSKPYRCFFENPYDTISPLQVSARDKWAYANSIEPESSHVITQLEDNDADIKS